MSRSNRIANSFRARFQKRHNHGLRGPLLATTILLYMVAVVMMIINVLGSNEWTKGSISGTFLLTSVVAPFVSIAFAFFLQLVTSMMENDKLLKAARAESLFLQTLEESITHSALRDLFLHHLLTEWQESLRDLRLGRITIQDSFWTVCANFFELCYVEVECTSSVPLEYWKSPDAGGNKELHEYRLAQMDLLINRDVPVHRTFIFRSLDDDETCKQFCEVSLEQMRAGFHVYLVDLSQIHDPEERRIASSDFAVLDDRMVMLGRQSGANQAVYFYDFFDLSALPEHQEDFLPAIELFEDVSLLLRRQNKSFLPPHSSPPKLRIQKYRTAVYRWPWLNNPRNNVQKTALESAAKELTCWKSS